MIPTTLNQWTLPIIEEILHQGYYENEVFDFKEMIPHKNDEKGKTGLRKACCAFANSSGGFLIFGIKDNKSLSIQDRLIGIEPTNEFLVEFGNYPSNCIPSIQWKPQDTPILLPNRNVLHVIQIYKSWDVPHCIENKNTVTHEWYCFPKRTNKGDEHMSYEEIRQGFLQYYEKRLKLQLLLNELYTIKERAKRFYRDGKADPYLGELPLTIIETILTDTYSLIIRENGLLYNLTQIRDSCSFINASIRAIVPIYYLGMTNKELIIYEHNNRVNQLCTQIINECSIAIERLQKVIDA